MIPVMVRRSGIAPDTKCNQITREQRRAFAELLKAYPVEITGFRPVEEAIVTSGRRIREGDQPEDHGVPSVWRGLYFAGEVIDVDAYTGGFNLQIAFCTGPPRGEIP